MVPVEPFYMVMFEELGVLLPAFAFNPFTSIQTVILGAVTFAAMGLGG